MELAHLILKTKTEFSILRRFFIDFPNLESPAPSSWTAVQSSHYKSLVMHWPWPEIIGGSHHWGSSKTTLQIEGHMNSNYIYIIYILYIYIDHIRSSKAPTSLAKMRFWQTSNSSFLQRLLAFENNYGPSHSRCCRILPSAQTRSY
jgi:hypothetical protein